MRKETNRMNAVMTTPEAQKFEREHGSTGPSQPPTGMRYRLVFPDGTVTLHANKRRAARALDRSGGFAVLEYHAHQITGNNWVEESWT